MTKLNYDLLVPRYLVFNKIRWVFSFFDNNQHRLVKLTFLDSVKLSQIWLFLMLTAYHDSADISDWEWWRKIEIIGLIYSQHQLLVLLSFVPMIGYSCFRLNSGLCFLFIKIHILDKAYNIVCLIAKDKLGCYFDQFCGDNLGFRY